LGVPGAKDFPSVTSSNVSTPRSEIWGRPVQNAKESFPLMSKILESHAWRDAMIACGTASMRGFRNQMEDGSAVLLSLNQSTSNKYRFCGVFDGHASSKKAATYLEEHLPRKIGEQKQKQWMSRSGLENACTQVDKEILRSNFSDAGSTAVFCVLQNSHTSSGSIRVSIGSVGDSQAMIMHSDFSKPPSVPLEQDIHRPHLMESEKDRIRKAGGFVANNRVDGELAVSRAFGDSRFKRDISRKLNEQKVIALPAVADNLHLHRGDILLLACDGLFDVMTPNVIDTFIRGTLLSELVRKQKDDKSLWSISETLSEVAGKLLDEAILRGSRDNMTVMLIHAVGTFPSSSRTMSWSDKFSKRYIPPIVFETSAVCGFNTMVKDELSILRLDEELTLSQCERISVGDAKGIPYGLSRSQMNSFLGTALAKQWDNRSSWVFLGEFEIPDPKYIFTGRRRASLVPAGTSGVWDKFVHWLATKMSCGVSKETESKKPQIVSQSARMSTSIAIFSRVSSVRRTTENSTTNMNSFDDDALFMVSSTSDIGATQDSRQTSADENMN
jgi:serine/threonine protein phosphatase PrpC